MSDAVMVPRPKAYPLSTGQEIDLFGHRWVVKGIHLGALWQESLIHLEGLSHEPGWTGPWEFHPMLFVPEIMLSAAMLAASTPIGGLGVLDRDWLIKVIREHSFAQDAADMIIGAIMFAAPPPPSVSTDNGPRPQEAVPTEGHGSAVLDLKPSPEAVAKIEALTRGAVGADVGRIIVGQQPADGCSSNEGAA